MCQVFTHKLVRRFIQQGLPGQSKRILLLDGLSVREHANFAWLWLALCIAEQMGVNLSRMGLSCDPHGSKLSCAVPIQKLSLGERDMRFSHRPVSLCLFREYYIKTNTSVVIRKPTTDHVSNRRGFHVQLHGCIFFKLRLVPPASVFIHRSSLATSSILLILAHPGVAPWRRVSSTHLHNPGEICRKLERGNQFHLKVQVRSPLYFGH